MRPADTTWPTSGERPGQARDDTDVSTRTRRGTYSRDPIVPWTKIVSSGSPARLEVVVQVQLDLSRDLTDDDQVEVGIGPIRLRQYDVGGPRL